MNPMESAWKQNGLPKPPLLGEVASSVSEDDGEVVQSSTCVIPLTLKASFVQPLSLASARQPFPFRHFRATSPGRGSLS